MVERSEVGHYECAMEQEEKDSHQGH
jgi:hypothetical protein